MNEDTSRPTTTHIQNDDWQSKKKNLKEKIAFLYKNDLYSDVCFIVGKGSSEMRIPAHKLILSIGSSVFNAMFNGSLAMNSEEIEISDVEPEAFLVLLKFLYSDNAFISSETVMQTLYAAKKYAIPILQAKCSKFLQKNLTSENAFLLLTQARFFEDANLLKKCLCTIDRNPDCFNASDFTEIDVETLCDVISRDTLEMKEIDVFDYAMKWSSSECRRQELSPTMNNKRAVLGRALKLIRFPLMTIDEFSDNVAGSGLLEDAEVSSIIRYIAATTKPSLEFPFSPRTPLEFVVNRFEKIENNATTIDQNRAGLLNTTHVIDFIVHRHNISVLGFGLFGTIGGPSTCRVSIHLIHFNITSTSDENFPGQFVFDGSHVTELTFDGSSSIFQARFQKEIPLLKNFRYSAAVRMDVPNDERSNPTYIGKNGRRTVNVDSPHGQITFEFLNFASNNPLETNVECGQIPEIIFKVCP